MNLNRILEDLQVTEKLHSPHLGKSKGKSTPKRAARRSLNSSNNEDWSFISESTSIHSQGFQANSLEVTVPKVILAMHSKNLNNEPIKGEIMKRFVETKSLRLITQMPFDDDEDSSENFPLVCGDSPSLGTHTLRSPSCADFTQSSISPIKTPLPHFADDADEEFTSRAVHRRSIVIDSPLANSSPLRMIQARQPATPPRRSLTSSPSSIVSPRARALNAHKAMSPSSSTIWFEDSSSTIDV